MKPEQYNCISPNGYVVNFDTQKRKKYDTDIIEAIRSLVLEKKSIRKIAEEINIPHSSVYNIIKRECMIKPKDQSKPSLMYLDRSECRYIHDTTDSDFDYIRTRHKEYTIKKGGKVYVHSSYFDKYKYGKEGYKDNYKNFGWYKKQEE